MKVRELMKTLSAKNAAEGVAESVAEGLAADVAAAEDAAVAESLDAEVTCGYACDLLSWVMAHGQPGMAWITVQTHVNVIAVAALMEMACVILPEGVELEEAAVKKAREENLPVLMSAKTAYELSGIMVKMGVPPPAV